MKEKTLSLLNGNQVLRENIYKFMNAFIEYYGEENRQFIEEQFNKALFIGYITPRERELLITSCLHEENNRIYDRIISETNIGLSAEEIFDYYTYESTLNPIVIYHTLKELKEMGEEGRLEKFRDEGYKYLSSIIRKLTRSQYEYLMTVDDFEKFCEGLPKFLIDDIRYYRNAENTNNKYKRLYGSIEKLLKSIDENITIENFTEYTFELDRIYELYEKYKQDYLDYKKDFEPFLSELEEIEKRKRVLESKYHQEFILENINNIPEHLREKVKGTIRSIQEGKRLTIDINMESIFGFSILFSSKMEAFSTEEEELLNSSETIDWKREHIINERIRYFNANGIDLGKDYNAYLNSEEAKRIWPNHIEVDKLVESRKKYISLFNAEFYENLEEHKKIRKEIESLGLLDRNDSFNARLYTNNGITLVDSNIRRIGNKYDIFGLILIHMHDRLDVLDHYICHELNHLVELSLKEVQGDTYQLICGWDIINGKITTEVSEIDTINDEEERRDYELFNEIINELISQDISEIMHKNGDYIFDNPEKSKYTRSSSYELLLFLVRDFYNEFKKEIIESRKGGKIEIIWNEVGKENFDALNDLFKIYQEHFGKTKIYGLLSSLIEKKDNEYTRAYSDLCYRRDEILKRMREHSRLRKEEQKNESINSKQPFAGLVA